MRTCGCNLCKTTHQPLCWFLTIKWTSKWLISCCTKCKRLSWSDKTKSRRKLQKNCYNGCSSRKQSNKMLVWIQPTQVWLKATSNNSRSCKKTSKSSHHSCKKSRESSISWRRCNRRQSFWKTSSGLINWWLFRKGKLCSLRTKEC